MIVPTFALFHTYEQLGWLGFFLRAFICLGMWVYSDDYDPPAQSGRSGRYMAHISRYMDTVATTGVIRGTYDQAFVHS